MVDVARTRRTRREVPAWTASVEASFGGYAQGTIERAKRFTRDRPLTFGLCAFSIGFLAGWRLKPW